VEAHGEWSQETESLADGTAILGLPAGLRWIARHDRQLMTHPGSSGCAVLGRPDDAAAPNHRWWRHTHRFSDAGDGTTRGAR